MAGRDVTIRFLGDVTDLQRSTVRVSETMEGNLGKLAGFGLLAGAGIAAVGAALGAFGLKAIQASADMEQTKIAFGTLLGSAQKADAFIRDLQAFAAKTPFTFTGLTASAKQLLAFGFAGKDVIPIMTAVGDSVSALGGGQEMIDRVTMALGQMKSKGKVSADEMLQLAEAGIPAWDMLAKKIGKDIPTTMKLAESGAIDASTGIAALTEGMEQRFGGLMAKQSGTLLGMWSNVQDAIGQTLTAIGQKIIATFDVKGKLGGFLDFLGKLQGLATGKLTLGQVIGPEAAASLERFAAAMRQIGDQVSQLLTQLAPFGAAISAALGPFIAGHLDAILIGVAVAVGALTLALGGLAIAFAIVEIVSSPLILIVLAAVAAIALLAAGAYLLAQNWNVVTGGLHAFWVKIQQAAATISGFIESHRVLAVVIGVLTGPIGLVIGGLALLITHWNEVSGAIGNAIGAMGRFVSFAWSNVKPVLDQIGQWAREAGDALGALNPFARHSPSLVDNVMAGTKLIEDHFADLAGSVVGSMTPVLAMQAAAPSNRSWTTNYNVHVSAGPVAHPAAIGRQIVEYIQEYERSGSRAWRGA